MKKNKIARNSAIAILLLAVLIAIPSLVAANEPTVSGNPVPVASSAPSTGGTDSTAGAPSTSGTDSSAGTPPPGTGGTDSSAGTPPPGTGGTDSSADQPGNGGGDTPPDSNPSGSSRSPVTSSSGGGGGFGFSTTNAVVTQAPATIGTCPLITTYMKRGGNNNSAEVAKLQAFLKNSELLNVEVTGTFDEKTEVAVRTFQNKYANAVLAPWGGTKTSGYVYITTSKKINELACAQPLSLNPSELTIINAFRTRLSTTDSSMTKSSQPETESASTMTDTDSTKNDPGEKEDNQIGKNTDTNSNVAGVTKASISARFWQFIRNLFR